MINSCREHNRHEEKKRRTFFGRPKSAIDVRERFSEVVPRDDGHSNRVRETFEKSFTLPVNI